MDIRDEEHASAFSTARDIGQRFGRTPSGHFWGRIILRLFGELLGQEDEFLVECRVNGLVEQYVAGTAWDYPGGRAAFMRILMAWLDEIRQYPPEVAKVAIESYLHARRRVRHQQVWRP